MIQEIANNLNSLSGVIALLAFLVSIAALYVSIKSLSLKFSNKVIGYYNYMSSIESSTPFIREIVLQNLKDKEVAIHDIYIKFGHNVYLDMLDKDSLNEAYIHVLPPLGTLTFNFGPVYLYSEQTQIADISKLIERKIQGKIILSTNDGMIKVKPIKKGWSPISEYFKNYGTVIIQSNRYYRKDSVCYNGDYKHKAIDYTSYGDRILYLVTLRLEDKSEVEYPIYQKLDYKVEKFSKQTFTEEILSSTKTLKEFLKKEKSKGRIQFESIVKIRDAHALINRDIKRYQKEEPIIIKAEGWFDYNIKDKFITLWWKFKDNYIRKF